MLSNEKFHCLVLTLFLTLERPLNLLWEIKLHTYYLICIYRCTYRKSSVSVSCQMQGRTGTDPHVSLCRVWTASNCGKIAEKKYCCVLLKVFITWPFQVWLFRSAFSVSTVQVHEYCCNIGPTESRVVLCLKAPLLRSLTAWEPQLLSTRLHEVKFIFRNVS